LADTLNRPDLETADRSPGNPGIVLRPPAEVDRAAFVSLRRASAEFLRPWEPRMWDDGEQFGDPSFDRLLTRAERETEEPFLITRRVDGVVVGYVGLGQIYRGPFRSCHIGYWIGAPWAGRGYAKAGVSACVANAFAPGSEGGLGLHRIEANIIPANAASIAVVKGVGFRMEGYSPRYLEIDGAWRDHERWAITTEDWESFAVRR
jgi:ribosomal-protein-alanine N-acetyltransferase